MKTCLVLEGGAMRGMFTAGVLDILIENDIEFDSVIGVSAGALFGLNLITKQKGRVIRYSRKYNKDRNYFGILPLIKTGNYIDTDYAYYRVPMNLDPFDNEKFKEKNKEFYAVVTNVETGKAEYVKITDPFGQMEILRASGTLPFISKKVKIDGKYYLDGGICDSIPYKKAIELNYDRIVVVLTQDISYVKKPINKTLVNLFYKNDENFKEALINRYKMYNNATNDLKKYEKEGKIFVIRPSKPIKIKRTERDENKLLEVYKLGLCDANKELKKLKEYLK